MAGMDGFPITRSPTRPSVSFSMLLTAAVADAASCSLWLTCRKRQASSLHANAEPQVLIIQLQGTQQ
jgi:hypothetical protein